MKGNKPCCCPCVRARFFQPPVDALSEPPAAVQIDCHQHHPSGSTVSGRVRVCVCVRVCVVQAPPVLLRPSPHPTLPAVPRATAQPANPELQWFACWRAAEAQPLSWRAGQRVGVCERVRRVLCCVRVSVKCQYLRLCSGSYRQRFCLSRGRPSGPYHWRRRRRHRPIPPPPIQALHPISAVITSRPPPALSPVCFLAPTTQSLNIARRRAARRIKRWAQERPLPRPPSRARPARRPSFACRRPLLLLLLLLPRPRQRPLRTSARRCHRGRERRR